MARVADEKQIDRPLGPIETLEEPVGIVSADAAALHELVEQEREVRGRIVTNPPGDMAVEEELPTADATHPQVAARRKGCKPKEELFELSSLIRLMMSIVNESEIPLYDTSDGVRPLLERAVQTRPPIGTAVYNFAGGTPGHRGHGKAPAS
jgi:hypothetical protein